MILNYARRLSIMLVGIAVLLVGAAPVEASHEFDDVDSTSLFHREVSQLAAARITRGCDPPENTLFCPDDAVTRGQMAAILHRALPHLSAGAATDFTDDDGHTFEADIEWLSATGVTRGCNPPDNGRFCPDDVVTRGQMAAFLSRALGLEEGSSVFSDTAGHLFEIDISSLADAGVTRGCNPPDTSRFCPDDPVTRGQMAAFLSRGLNLEDVELPRIVTWRVWHVDQVGDPDVLFANCPASDPARIPDGNCYAEVDPTADFFWKLGTGEADIGIFSRAAELIAPGGAGHGLPVRVSLEDTGVPRQGAFGDNTEWVTEVEIVMTGTVGCPPQFVEDVHALSEPDEAYFVSTPTCTADGWAVAEASVDMTPVWELFSAHDVDTYMRGPSVDVGFPYQELLDLGVPEPTAVTFVLALWQE